MSSDLPFPPASFERRPIAESWTRPIIRVHSSELGANEFNPGLGSGGRFDPLRDANGVAVPTLYGASTFNGALSETVFRNVPVRGSRSLRALTLIPLRVSTLQARRVLRLIDLRGFGLQRLGVSRRELIDSDSDHYPVTRAWAEALYRAVDDADGMIWVARQYDISEAILLFGTRIGHTDLEVVAGPRPLATVENIEPDVIAAADAAGIPIVVL